MTDRQHQSLRDRPSVLLADDHPALRAGIRLRLEMDGAAHVVGEAADGRSALEQVRDLVPTIAIVDLRMPEVDGLQLIDAVHVEKLGTRVILLSALSEAHLVQQALELGAFGYVSKESPMDVVVDAVRTVARGNRFVDPMLLPSLLGTASEHLTDREREVLQLAADGMQNKVIAQQLGLGEETVKSHLSHVMRKLDAQSRTEAVAAALRRALIR